MRLVQTLALDLAGTRSAVRKPSGLAAALVYRTTGLLGTEVEEEVVSMVGLAEKVYDALVEVGIDNVVRLSVDADVLYEDLLGRESDLEHAFAKALERGIETAGRIQIVLERRTERLHLVVRIDVHREHLPGAFPVWVRLWALPLEFLRARRERRERHVRRIADVLADEPARARFEAGVEAALDEVAAPLEGALRKRLPVKVVQSGRTWRHRRADEDYFFCLRPETNEAVEAAIRAAEEVLPERRRSAGMSIPEYVERGEALIRKMEARLRPSSGAEGGGTPPLTWEAFSRRKVYNPATRKIVRIRSLAPAQQARYQMLFNAQVLDPERRVDVYEPPGPLDRLAASTRRGVTKAVDRTAARLARQAPRTHAFLSDGAYRKAVLKETAPLLGKELYDQADVLAHTIVGEIYETAKVPLAWWSGRKMTIDERDKARLAEARDQLLDLLELAAGTLVPIGAWAAGGPLGGLAGLAGIKVFQKALNWFSKRHGDGREWTIRPSRMIARQAEVDAKRAPEREDRRERLEAVRRRNEPPAEADRAHLESELAETFREYGKMLEEKKVDFAGSDVDLATFKEQDLLAAIEEEARASRESANAGASEAK